MMFCYALIKFLTSSMHSLSGFLLVPRAPDAAIQTKCVSAMRSGGEKPKPTDNLLIKA